MNYIILHVIDIFHKQYPTYATYVIGIKMNVTSLPRWPSPSLVAKARVLHLKGNSHSSEHFILFKFCKCIYDDVKSTLRTEGEGLY